MVSQCPGRYNRQISIYEQADSLSQHAGAAVTGHWNIKDDQLVFRTGSGSLVTPSSGDIYALVYAPSGARTGDSRLPSPMVDLPDLQFRPYPLNPVIVLDGSSIDSLRAFVAVRIGDHLVAKSNSPDHVVHESCWYPVTSEGLEECFNVLRQYDVQPGSAMSLGTYLRFRLTTDAPVEILDRVSMAANQLELDAGQAAVEPNGGLQANLYDYQVTGVSYLQLVARHRLGCILGDEMGLGKTLQVIGLLIHETDRHATPSLVVAPATLLENWRRELATFAPSLHTLVHQGSARTGVPSGLRRADVVITSYETAVQDEDILMRVNWHCIVLDEAQNIKNPAAQRTRTVKHLPRNVSIAVTGTPVENSLMDLWSICDFILPGYLGTSGQFMGRYSDTIDDASDLGERVQSLLLRRRVADVAGDLPTRIDIPQVIPMDEQVAGIYESIRSGFNNGQNRRNTLQTITALRQLCARPSLAASGSKPESAPTGKLVRLVEIADEIFASREKLVIFASYRQSIDQIAQTAASTWPSLWLGFIDGRTAIIGRQRIVDQFSGVQGSALLILNPRAAGVGLNITAANHVVHFNPEWNPAVTDQASARVFRRKQTRPVTIHHLLYAGTVDEVIAERSLSKRHLADGATAGVQTISDDLLITRIMAASPTFLWNRRSA